MSIHTFQTVLISSLCSVFVLCGCTSTEPTARTGFLSDYSQLRQTSSTTLQYVDGQQLEKYEAFIIEPVRFQLDSETDMLSRQDINNLSSYMHRRIVEAVIASDHEVTHRAGPEVARIRAAITDIDNTSATIPVTSINGPGFKGAAIEAEILDTYTGEQVSAVVDSQKSFRIPLTSINDWSATKEAMDRWGEKLRKQLESDSEY